MPRTRLVGAGRTGALGRAGESERRERAQVLADLRPAQVIEHDVDTTPGICIQDLLCEAAGGLRGIHRSTGTGGQCRSAPGVGAGTGNRGRRPAAGRIDQRAAHTARSAVQVRRTLTAAPGSRRAAPRSTQAKRESGNVTACNGSIPSGRTIQPDGVATTACLGITTSPGRPTHVHLTSTGSSSHDAGTPARSPPRHRTSHCRSPPGADSRFVLAGAHHHVGPPGADGLRLHARTGLCVARVPAGLRAPGASVLAGSAQ